MLHISGSAFSVIFAILISGSDGVLWEDFRMTFNSNYPEGGGFERLPRTTREAVANSWFTDSINCTNNAKFYGYRYTDYKDPSPEFVALLFDVQGIIAGLQIYIPQSELLFDSKVRFDRIPMYQNDTIDGIIYFVVTVYFVDPEIICNGGRPEAEVSVRTGRELVFQSGPSPSDLVQVPNDTSEALADGDWGNNSCVPAMGHHSYYQVKDWELNQCQKIPPAFGIYSNDGQLLGFGFNVLAKVDSLKFETNTTADLLLSLQGEDKFPQCYFDLNARVGITTLHIYFVDNPWTIKCP